MNKKNKLKFEMQNIIDELNKVEREIFKYSVAVPITNEESVRTFSEKEFEDYWKFIEKREIFLNKFESIAKEYYK